VDFKLGDRVGLINRPERVGIIRKEAFNYFNNTTEWDLDFVVEVEFDEYPSSNVIAFPRELFLIEAKGQKSGFGKWITK
jgi:hypothetical protein